MMTKYIKYDERQDSWIELWQAPFHFRAFYTDGGYIKGSKLDELVSQHQSLKHATLKIDKQAALICIYWEWEDEEGEPRHISGKWGLDIHSEFDPVPGGRFIPPTKELPLPLQYLPPELQQDGRNALTQMRNIRSRLIQEFRFSADANKCKVYARIGSKLAPHFTEIPADVFNSAIITKWGYGNSGGGEAALEGKPELYSIYVAPPDDLDTEELVNVNDKPELPPSKFHGKKTIITISELHEMLISHYPDENDVFGLNIIYEKLEKGSLRAKGLKGDASIGEFIPIDFWELGRLDPLQVIQGNQSAIQAYPSSASFGSPKYINNSYRNIYFKQDEILELWPELFQGKLPDTSDRLGKAIQHVHNEYVRYKLEGADYSDDTIWGLIQKEDYEIYPRLNFWSASTFRQIKSGHFKSGKKRNFGPITNV